MAPARTDVSEELIASIFRLKEHSKLGKSSNYVVSADVLRSLIFSP
jgi:hypothetical protein